MTVITKISGKDGNTILNDSAKGNDPREFSFEFPCLPHKDDLIKIQDGDAIGEYVVAYPIVYEIAENKSFPIMILKWQKLPKEIGEAIDN